MSRTHNTLCVCVVCGNKFMGHNPRYNLCSDECRVPHRKAQIRIIWARYKAKCRSGYVPKLRQAAKPSDPFNPIAVEDRSPTWPWKATAGGGR